MYTSLADTSETLRSLLEAELLADVGPNGLASFIGGANTEVALATPQEMTRQKKHGLSVWLYRVARDETRLNDPPRVRPAPLGGVELVPLVPQEELKDLLRMFFPHILCCLRQYRG